MMAQQKTKNVGDFIRWVKCLFKPDCAGEDRKQDHEEAEKERAAKRKEDKEQQEKQEIENEKIKLREEETRIAQKKKLLEEQEKKINMTLVHNNAFNKTQKNKNTTSLQHANQTE